MKITTRSESDQNSLFSIMVVQIAGVVMLPIIMMIVTASPFDEPISVKSIDETPIENSV